MRGLCWGWEARGAGKGRPAMEGGGEDGLPWPAPVGELRKQEVHHYLSDGGFNQLCSSAEDRFNIKAHFQSHYFNYDRCLQTGRLCFQT